MGFNPGVRTPAVAVGLQLKKRNFGNVKVQHYGFGEQRNV